MSGAITLRNVPEEVLRAIRHRAKVKGVSANRAVIGLLEESLGVASKGRRKRRYDDLDALFGRWSRAEADRFERNLAEQRTIDEEMWK